MANAVSLSAWCMLHIALALDESPSERHLHGARKANSLHKIAHIILHFSFVTWKQPLESDLVRWCCICCVS